MSATWNQNFFERQATGRSSAPVRWSVWDSANENKVYDSSFFDIPGGDLGKREIRSNKNLLNEKEFAKYWQTGKHKDHKIYNGVDIDGDDVDDLIAVDPQGRIVGFNDRYVTDKGKGETFYKKAYYKMPKEQRNNISYQQFLETQETEEGWKDLTKFKESRAKATHRVIRDYLDEELGQAKATEKQSETIAKHLLNLIITTFFDLSTPIYQIKVISGSAEFKKVLKSKITAETIGNYLPAAYKQTIANSMVSAARGYSDGGMRAALKTQILDKISENRLSAKDANALYLRILSKSAASKAYKQFGITPMYLVDNPNQAEAFAAEVKKIMDELDQKHKMEAVNFLKA